MSLVSSKQVDTNRTELIVKIESEQFKKAVDTAFRKNAKKISLPGFRKGKAPRAMIERAYGQGVFYDDAMNELYPSAYSEAIREADIEPVDVADVEVIEVGEDGFVFKATVTTKPEAELGEYSGIEGVREVREVTDEEIDKSIAALRERNARVTAVSDRPAKNGDEADIDFEGFADGVAFEGGKGTNYPLTLGSGSFIPGFEEQVVGHSIGEEFEVPVTFPADYQESSLAGKPVVFKVKINEIQEKQLPELDDEFAKDISEFDTLEAYRADLRAKLIIQNEEQAKTEFENSLVDTVVDNMKVEIPRCMIDARIDELVQDFGARLAQQGLKLADFIRYSGEDEEKFRESFRPQAERQVKARLAMETVAKKEALLATEDDLEAEYAKLAENYKVEAEKVRLAIPEKEIKADIVCRKALEFLVQHGKAVTKKALDAVAEKAAEVADAIEEKTSERQKGE